MSDSTAIGFAMVGCAYFGFFMVLSIIAVIAVGIRLIFELIKEAINKSKESEQE